MARGRGRGKSYGRSNSVVHVSMPTIPMPTIVSPQQGGTPIVDTSAQRNTPTISETPLATPNQNNPIDQGLSTQSIPTGGSNPIAEGDLSTQSNPRGHTNTIAEADSSNSHTRTLILITSAWLEPSITCSSFITKSFRNDVDPNGINWKSVSNDVNDGYFGEFKAIEKDRDPTPSELHLHVHTHGHDGKSFVDERSRIVHEKYDEILQEKTTSQSDIDQCDECRFS